MSKIEFIVDLAHQDLHTIPDYVSEKHNLKLLYLEDNNLKNVPSELFVCLEHLVWLDLRCNKLSTLPNSIGDHRCLETLLLQDNFFEELPAEIGLIESLKVLQLSGNPIKYPGSKVLEAGTQSIKEFLKKEYEKKHKTKKQLSEESLEDVSDESLMNIYDIQTSNSDIITPRVKIEPAKKRIRNIFKTGNLKSKYVPKKYSKLNIYKNKPHYNSNKYVKSQMPKNSQTHVQFQTAREMWLKALRALLNKQEEVIQREKYVPQYRYTIFENLEALQEWRHTVKQKVKDEKDYKLNVPYDTDPTYDKLLTRQDLKISEKVKKPYQPKEKLDIAKLISDIADSLKLLERDTDTSKTPTTQMDIASKEIKWILELQKRLSVLKLQNDVNIQ